MPAPEDLLNQYWGYSSFLPRQKEIIASVLGGTDTLAILATGSGKSLCYQLPALCLGGLTLVISPLIALMKDQVDDLNARGIPAAAYNSALEYRQRTEVEADLRNEAIRLLFVSPEKCVQNGFLDLIATTRLRLIAIDEAHCISEWGHDFRPEYRQLKQVRDRFPDVPVIALTATAIPKVRADIRDQLRLVRPNEFVGTFNRKNLHYRVLEKTNPLETIRECLARHRGESGIIYCLSKQETEDLAAELRKRGYKALAYHAGLPRQERARVQDAFIRDNVQVICATIAFGMGINKPDIRFVIHHTIPKSIESYYQETGRAGRDGLESECILLYSRGDRNRVRAVITRDDADERHVRMALKKLQEMGDYCEAVTCRRSYLLSYFGEAYPDTGCGSCDACENPRERIDGTEIAKMIVACVRQLPSAFGAGLITDILTGTETEKIRSYRFDKLPSYAAGRSYSKPQLRTWIADLVAQGYLAREGDEYPVIRLTRKSPDLLDGRATALLPAPETPGGRPSARRKTGTIAPADEGLFLHLKQTRKSLADKRNVPPYVIFSDKSLKEMAAVRPGDADQFRQITGVGSFKLEHYGPVFLSAISAFRAAEESDPAAAVP